MSSSAKTLPNARLLAKSSRNFWPARLDLLQSTTGLILALFMWGHMFFVASILLGKDAMWMVSKFFEGYFFFGTAHPWLVSLAVVAIVLLFMVHAILALRKFPANYNQFREFRLHQKSFRHPDTTYWYWQALTGFALFFLASPHLFIMLTQPDSIGPYGSADRIWSDGLWGLYILLLFTVELHGGIGLYRLAVKWGWFEGNDPAASRARLQKLKWALTVFFIVLGLLTLAAYVKIGIEHADQYGERYIPEYIQKTKPLAGDS